MSNQDIYKGATCKTCGGTVPDGHVPSEFDALGQGHPDHELKPKLITNQTSEDKLINEVADILNNNLHASCECYECVITWNDSDAIPLVTDLIRTEKLKLLAEVREQTTIFKIKAHDKKGQPHLYEAGRGVPTDVLAKLEAEL